MTGTAPPAIGLETRRRRMLFRAWHRGTREMDLIMGRFADAHIVAWTEPEMAEFEHLLELPDPDVYAWIIGDRPTPEAHDTPLLRRLRAFHLTDKR